MERSAANGTVTSTAKNHRLKSTRLRLHLVRHGARDERRAVDEQLSTLAEDGVAIEPPPDAA
jgi:hypothetical protein